MSARLPERLLAGLVPAALLLAAPLTPAGPGPGPAQESVPRPSILGQVAKPYTLNNPVLEFRLPDLAGREHLVAGPADERLVLLCFWSFQDPPSRFYVPELTRLQQRYAERLALYLVDSNADELTVGNADPLERVRRWFQEQKVTLPLLLDRGNVVADDFAAVANGQVFLIDGNHTLRYHGGIDDDPDGQRRAAGLPVNRWLEQALEPLLEGRLPEHPWTRPAGRPIKRVKKAGAR